MKNKKQLVISIILLVLVLIGVTIIQPLTASFKWLLPFQPAIVITGFFTFIVAASLFVYVVIKNIKK